MEPAAKTKSYNERLFAKGFRRRWHLARFHWLADVLEADFGGRLADASVVELGCFDGKTLRFLRTPPKTYSGFDANWGNGLDLAREQWKGMPGVSFQECTTPQQLVGRYDLALCLETIEHLPLALLDGFIAKLAESAPVLYATVPVEFGPLFAAKHAYKVLTRNRPDSYGLSEFISCSLGMTSRVKREEFGHKGFDYRDLVALMRKYYSGVTATNIVSPTLPLQLAPSVGLVARR
jgi:hypothetical protein